MAPITPTVSIRELVDIFIDGGQFAAKFLEDDSQKFAVKYNLALKEYLKIKTDNLSKIKMAFFSSDVVDLREIYVPQNLVFKDDSYSKDEFIKLLPQHKKMVISATAGSGKSCFLKSIFIDIIINKVSLFPLFLELRKVNETADSIFQTLLADIAIHNDKFNSENLTYLLNRNKTILFLDGFDEVNHDLKSQYLKEVNELAEKYPQLIIIASSRPEYNDFKDWVFDVSKIAPLNLSQAIEIIQKLYYEEDVKDRFIQALNDNLFSAHKSFSSNPLLLTIMLVTYEQFGDIPDKVHIFYDLAYQALFNKHDVSKQGFRRKSSTGLDMYALRDVFSLFCLITYSKQVFEMPEGDLDALLGKCLTHFKHDIKYDALKTELLSNVPLLMRDGLNYCFTHRSFQEYFTAYYLTHNKANSKFFDKVGARYRSDNVVDMMFSMNRRVLEDNWILPKIDKIINSLPSKLETTDEKIETLLVFCQTLINLSNRNNSNTLDHSINSDNAAEAKIGYVATENLSLLRFLLGKYDCMGFYKERSKEFRIHNDDRQIEFISGAFKNGQDFVEIKDLSSYSKELLCEIRGNEINQVSLISFEHIKELITKDRVDLENSIESMFSDLLSE